MSFEDLMDAFNSGDEVSFYKTMKVRDFIEFNPKESLKKGELATKVTMDKLLPFEKFISSMEQAPFSGGSKFKNGDTLLARITPCLENGKTAFVDGLKEGEVAFGSTEFIVLRCREGVSDPQYIYYLATSSFFRNVAIKSMVGSSGRQRVQIGALEDIDIKVPSLEEQRRIASRLALLDSKIALNSRINDNLEHQILSLYDHLFVKQKESDWAKGTLSDIGTIVGGGTPSKSRTEYYAESGIAWITPKDLSINKSKYIYHGEIDISDLGLKKSSARLVPAGTVLFSSRAPIGYIAIAGHELTTNQGFKSVIPNQTIGTAFIYCFLKRNLPLIESMSSGSTFKEVSGSVMKQVPVTIPSQESLRIFNQFTHSLFEQQKMLEKENCTLTKIRDSLLSKFFS